MFSPIVRAHAIKPRNHGELPEATSRGESHYRKCGDHFSLWLEVVDGRIAKARFKARACAPVTAMGSVGTGLLHGLSVGEALKINAFELDERLGGLPPAKRHAILLFLDALHQALSATVQEPEAHQA
jgi:NifU-like protein involved in Fe-S cluster formation